MCCLNCGCVLTKKLSRIDFLATKYNDGQGSVFKIFDALKIDGDDRLQWIDTWAAMDKDQSNSMDEKEFHQVRARSPYSYYYSYDSSYFTPFPPVLRHAPDDVLSPAVRDLRPGLQQ